MSARRWSYYRAADGVFTGKRRIARDVRAVERDAPQGCLAIEGSYDRLSQRVDVGTGEVVDYQPPAPDADHEWNPERRRWVKRADVASWEARRAAAIARINELERSQLRPMRELARNQGATEARRRLDEIDAEIEAQRAIVNAPKP